MHFSMMIYKERINAVCIPEINGIVIRDDVINDNPILWQRPHYTMSYCIVCIRLKHIDETIMSPNAGNITWIVDNIGVELAVQDV